MQVVAFVRLKECRSSGQSLIIHEVAKTFNADLALPDVVMAVEVRSELAFRVIEVKRLDRIDTNDLFKARHRLSIAVASRQSYPATNTWQVSKQTPSRSGCGNPVQDLGKIFKLAPDRRPLTGGRLQQRHNAVSGKITMDAVEGLNDPLDSCLPARPVCAPGMRDNERNSETFAAFKLLDLTCDRLSPTGRPSATPC